MSTNTGGLNRLDADGRNFVRYFHDSDNATSLAHKWVYALHRGASRRLWIERIGWMTWDDFFRKQGVVEASNIPFSNPISISDAGTEVVGGIVGASFSWLVNMNQVFVCERGNSIQTGFPNGLRGSLTASLLLSVRRSLPHACRRLHSASRPRYHWCSSVNSNLRSFV